MAAGEITPRKIYIQDLALTTDPDGETETVPVMGLGNTEVNKIDMLRFSQFGQYADDGAAAGGGVEVGQLYYNTTNSKLHVRMS